MNTQQGRGSRAGLSFGIGAKLYLHVGFSLALIAAASYVGARALVDTLEIERRMETETLPRVLYAVHLSQRTASVIAAGRAAIEDTARDAEIVRTLAEVRRLFAVALARAREAWPGANAIARVAARSDALDARVDATRDASPLALPALAPLERALIDATERANVEALSSARILREQATRTLDEAIVLFAVLNIAGFATLAVSVWLFARRVIVRRIEALSKSMRQMAGGDLEVPIDVEGNDELADMGYALDIFRGHAREIQRLNVVERLSGELKEKNAALEHALDDLHRAQDQVVHQEKLAALGQLTAGVAHEIQNPLNFIENFSIGSSRLLEELKELLDAEMLDRKAVEEIGTEIETNLVRVVEHSKRADNIVKAMLLHSRTAPGDRVEIDVNATITEYANLAYHGQCAHDGGFNLTIEKRLAPEAGTVCAVEQDLGRLFLNLLTNACQATAERAKTGDADYAPALTLESARDDTHVHVRITDNGGGIPTDVRERMFDPFFTTRPSQVGTGLGLSISNDIVRAHGGTITCESNEGAWTRFTVSLPSERTKAAGTRAPDEGK